MFYSVDNGERTYRVLATALAMVPLMALAMERKVLVYIQARYCTKAHKQ